ncbi:MAG: hypothetical protein R2865_14660 [Deinococcales bacterium]
MTIKMNCTCHLSGMSLDARQSISPLVLDERTEGNLTRNIVIEAPNDSLWRNQGF